jgi:hypothetical protein
MAPSLVYQKPWSDIMGLLKVKEDFRAGRLMDLLREDCDDTQTTYIGLVCIAGMQQGCIRL